MELLDASLSRKMSLQMCLESISRAIDCHSNRYTFQCRPCYEAGIPLESDGSGDDSSSVDDELESVAQCDNLYVGMAYEAGTILEIYPEIDKLTVQLAHGEIQHLKSFVKGLRMPDLRSFNWYLQSHGVQGKLICGFKSHANLFKKLYGITWACYAKPRASSSRWVGAH